MAEGRTNAVAKTWHREQSLKDTWFIYASGNDGSGKRRTVCLVNRTVQVSETVEPGVRIVREMCVPSADADAALIEAAPEMLTALKLFLHEHDQTYDGAPLSQEMAKFVEAARAAVKKAEAV